MFVITFAVSCSATPVEVLVTAQWFDQDIAECAAGKLNAVVAVAAGGVVAHTQITDRNVAGADRDADPA